MKILWNMKLKAILTCHEIDFVFSTWTVFSTTDYCVCLHLEHISFVFELTNQLILYSSSPTVILTTALKFAVSGILPILYFNYLTVI